MIAQLRKFDRLKQDFVATVSHDLKSPLASLRETTSLLLDEIPGPLAASQRRVLLLQRESADRLGRMIAKLLELSRLDAAVPVRMRALNPRDPIEQRRRPRERCRGTPRCMRDTGCRASRRFDNRRRRGRAAPAARQLARECGQVFAARRRGGTQRTLGRWPSRAVRPTADPEFRRNM